MKSKWFEYKKEVRKLRRQGVSLTTIERQYGIPRSTLSGWLKDIPLTEEQRTRLMKNSQDGWQKARVQAAKQHRAQKELRLEKAAKDASEVVERLPINHDILDLAFAMLYFGEGAKGNVTSIANTDPVVLNFVLDVLEYSYDIGRSRVRCDLHIRADQDPETLKQYWSEQLCVPVQQFRGCYADKRTLGRASYDHYKGVCLIYCGPIDIQRKLKNVYNMFCKRVSMLGSVDG